LGDFIISNGVKILGFWVVGCCVFVFVASLKMKNNTKVKAKKNHDGIAYTTLVQMNITSCKWYNLLAIFFPIEYIGVSL
jgi:hypothetical protein